MKELIPDSDGYSGSDDEVPPGGIFNAGNNVLIASDSDVDEDDPPLGEPSNLHLASEDEVAAQLGEPSNLHLASENEDDVHSLPSVDSDESSEYEDSDECSDADETMEELFGVKPAIEAQRDHPPNIENKLGVIDICFHPSEDLLAASTLNGDVFMYKYSKEETVEEAQYKIHSKSCRAISFDEEGQLLFSVSTDRSFAAVDVSSSKTYFHIMDAHETAINCLYPVSENICATGDDDGVVKLWDLRTKQSVFDFRCGEQTVSSLAADIDGKFVVATVNDGSLAAFNVPRRRLEMQSEMYKSELTSLCFVRSGTRLVAGSGEGTLFIFKHGEFAYHIDQYAGHPDYINCLLPLTDNLILTGCEDGFIRAVHLYGHRFVGVCGEHDSFGVENMSLSSEGSILATCSMVEDIKFWNVEYLYNVKINEKRKQSKSVDVGKNLQSSRRRNRDEFFNDFPEQLDSDDDGGPVDCPGHTSQVENETANNVGSDDGDDSD